MWQLEHEMSWLEAQQAHQVLDALEAAEEHAQDEARRRAQRERAGIGR